MTPVIVQQQQTDDSNGDAIRDRFSLDLLGCFRAIRTDPDRWPRETLTSLFLPGVCSSACLVWLRPASAAPLVFLTAFTGCALLWQLQWMTNQRICNAIASVMNSVGALSSLMRRCSDGFRGLDSIVTLPLEHGQWACKYPGRFAPVLSWPVSLSYSTVAVRELNTDIFNSKQSCATDCRLQNPSNVQVCGCDDGAWGGTADADES